MAVSGRKASDSLGSISTGSAEDFQQICEPCLAIGQQIEAHVFCVECQEYLCKNCIAYHQRIKATKYHKLLDKDNMEKQTIHSTDSTVCVQKCSIHKREMIKFFCTNHEFLGCTDCITMNHRSCKIDYIPDKCAGIGDSDEYRETLKDLDQKMIHMDAFVERATKQDKEIDDFYDSAMKQIVKFSQEINDHLDELQNKIQTDADRRKYKSKETVKKVLEICTATSSDMIKFKTSLQDSKTSQQDGQLYITLKQAKSKLKMGDFKDGEVSLETVCSQYTFERNKDIETLLTKQETFGNLSITPNLLTPRKTKVFEELVHNGYLNLRTKSDRFDCYITGCAILSSNNLLLADHKNKKLKVVDTQSKVVIEEKSLDSAPWGIAVLSKDHTAVTIPDKKQILIMIKEDKLFISRKIPVTATCSGISCHQGRLFVMCWDPLSVIILDTQGTVKNRISLNNDIYLLIHTTYC